MTVWHLITGEYPPNRGGVSDYSRLLAAELVAAGDEVHVWCPAIEGPTPAVPGVTVHRALGRLRPADLRRAGVELSRFRGPRRLLVQWVPHAYGYRSVNVFFCLWLWKRARLHGDRVEIMAHEAYLAFERGTWKRSAAALLQRLMTALLLNAAQRVWVSIPAWEHLWRPYTLGRFVPFGWLPIPSSIPCVDDPDGVAAIRTRYAPNGERLIGHFGTYGAAITEMLKAVLSRVLRDRADSAVLLLGPGGEAVRDSLCRERPALAGGVHATGGLAAPDLSRHVSACDVMVQPYPDGISSRRSSAMATLAHGLPVVTTAGALTESLWAESGAVRLAPVGDLDALAELTRRVIQDDVERNRLRAAARTLYQDRFDVRHTVDALRAVSQ